VTGGAANVGDSLARARQLLEPGPGGALEAEILLAHVMEVNRSWLFANREQALRAKDSECFMSLVERRANGEPIAYLTGVREFWSLPLQVTGRGRSELHTARRRLAGGRSGHRQWRRGPGHRP
jgi:methylase of polypeptide subunit release factors